MLFYKTVLMRYLNKFMFYRNTTFFNNVKGIVRNAEV